MILARPLFLACLLALPVGAQGLSDRFREQYKAWETTLERGDGASVRKSLEALLQREGQAVNPSDYNEMRALVGALDVAARACVLEGSWEDAVAYLQKASQTASENTTASAATFAKVRKEHEQKLTEWREEVTRQERRLKDLEAQPGLTESQMKLQSQIRAFLDEHRNAIANSERALKEIESLLVQIRKVQETYGKSLDEWKAFLAKEKLEVAQAGSSAKYVSEKLEQVKTDDAKPRFERIAYGRRLVRLDPANTECQRFVNGLLGIEEKEEPAAKPAPQKKSRSRKKGK